MNNSFSLTLDQWSTYFALMGGAAATLLGLLFVAVSLRLNIFHQREVADVRDYAALTLGTFLVAIAVAGVTLAPHEHPGFVAPALLVIGVAGFLGVVRVARVSIALNRVLTEPHPGPLSHLWKGWPYALFVTCPYVAVIGAAVLLWIGHADALGWLAITEGWLLVSGTLVAWILLSHAGNVGGQEPPPTQPPQS
jgi:hypothetical protein